MLVIPEAGHDAVFFGEAVAIVTGLEWLDQDDVGVYVVGKHDEVVAAARAEGETAHVIGVELAYGLYTDMEFLGFGCRLRWCRWFGRSCDLGGADSFSHLLDMALESFNGDRAILGRVGGVEAYPGSVVACFDVL